LRLDLCRLIDKTSKDKSFTRKLKQNKSSCRVEASSVAGFLCDKGACIFKKMAWRVQS
jgi:hypothetical protein